MEKDTCQRMMESCCRCGIGMDVYQPAEKPNRRLRRPRHRRNTPISICRTAIGTIRRFSSRGKAIFTGVENIDVNCASCHGKDGKPVKAGARDFRNGEHMKLFSDSQWFWRVSEGSRARK